MVVEKTGLLNLGIEGMMAIGAAVAFIIVYQTGSHGLGFLGGAFAGLALSMVFAVLVITLKVNEVAAGLALSVLGLGLSALFGKTYESLTVEGLASWRFRGCRAFRCSGQRCSRRILSSGWRCRSRWRWAMS